jgi:hypothetical protein
VLAAPDGRRLALLAVAALCLIAAPAPCQEAPGPAADREPAVANPSGRRYPPRIYRATRLAGEVPSIDGRLDDAAWKLGEWGGGFTQQIPVEGAAPSQPTELKILYDDRHVYFAVRAWDDPALVHRYPGRRDDFAGDIVGICFDSYNDKRTGFEFDLTAGGSKIDLILGNGETEWDTTWDAVWDGEVAHDAEGWTAEFRVPLSQLRYDGQDEQVWGLHAWRWLDRNQEESQWQLIPRRNTGRMHQLGELHGIRGLPPARRIEVLPHVVGELGSGPSTAGDSRETRGSLGLDAKMGLGSNFTLDATVNPDFGQVEADPSVVNLTAFETFFEEKRPFFLEGKKILSFGIDDSDQLFYSRRIGQAPSHAPLVPDGGRVRAPESTTILGALKVSGKTGGGLSVGILQSVTEKETAEITAPLGTTRPVVEPFGSYTVARVHKDWDKGNTSLGGMATATLRSISDPALEFLPARAFTGGVDFTRYFGNRAFVLEAKGVVSHVGGEREAILALQTNPLHFFQRPDAGHLGVDDSATSLSGHGGSVQLGTSGQGRVRLTERFHWYSPGLDLNDVGYLRQADLRENQVSVGWSEPSPRWIFRDYGLELEREDGWDFGGLATWSRTSLAAEGQFRNKWRASFGVDYEDVVDTRMLRGGPALRWHDYYETEWSAQTDQSRRVWAKAHGSQSWARDDDSRGATRGAYLNFRLSNRLSVSASGLYELLHDNLQYVATAETSTGPRWVLGRLEQDTWSFTFRVNLALTPDLTVQYYGSPFIGTGQYRAFKRATETLARAGSDRVHLYGSDEIAYLAGPNHYRVEETGGAAAFSFPNPDFSFREFRSNLVARWEWKPGSALYVVWSQGRSGRVPSWESSFATNWDELWRAPADNVFLVKLSYWFSP